jgi:superfamily II DNA or RNA helicase
MLTPRPYQEHAIAQLDDAERRGVTRPLVVHPTGTGKTVTFAHWLARRAERGRGIILVNREELAEQAVDKLSMVAPELNVGVVKAERHEVDADIVVGSVPTLQHDARMAELLASAGSFHTVVVDEAHHAPAPSWTKVLTALGSFNPYGPTTAGFTATPERDGKPLTVWQEVVAYMSIREAIYGDRRKGEQGGYLVPIQPAQTIETKMDLGRVRKTGGDYSEGDLGTELEGSGAIEQIADGIKEHASDRKGVVFTPTIRTAELVAEALRARGITAEAVSGNTPKQERKDILARLKSGQTQYVTNCAVLTEGFDEPSISCIVVARPTKFHGLYVQMIGRGTRLHPGKVDLLILDVVGASTRHELITRVDLDDLPPDQRRKKKTEPSEGLQCAMCDGPCTDLEAHACKLCGRILPVRLIKDEETRHETCQVGKTEKVDVFGKSRLRWLEVEDAFVLGAGKGVIIMAPTGTADVWRLATYEQNRVQVLHQELPGEWARGIGEDHAKAFLKLNERDARWLARPASQSQLTRLLNEGLPEKHIHRVRTQEDAANLITRIVGRRGVRKLQG